MPALQRNLEAAIAGCPDDARHHAHRALGGFGQDAHRHSQAMLQALQRQGARARKRGAELAQSVLAQAKADRERLRLSSPGGVADYSDADLEGPLVALSRHLRRRNATFALDDQTMRAWEESAAEALRGGGDPAEKHLAMNLAHLVQKAPLPQNDRMRNLVFSDESHAVEHFVALLQRARLHHHVGGLLERLDAWERHEAPVWDVIEQIESLRARHVFPMSLLRLAEHEWDQIIDAAERQHGRTSQSFEADQ